MLAKNAIDKAMENYTKTAFSEKLLKEDIPMYFLRYLTYDQMKYISNFHNETTGKKLYERDRYHNVNTKTAASEKTPYKDIGKIAFTDNHKGSKVTVAIFNHSEERQLFTKALQQFDPKFIIDAAEHYGSSEQSEIYADALSILEKDYNELPKEYKVN